MATTPDFAPWYVREDYDNIRKVMDDGDKLPPTYDEWEKLAKSQVADIARGGTVIKPVILNSEKFIAFCQDKKISPDSKGRALFAVERGRAESLG
jgi:hypothetical protein